VSSGLSVVSLLSFIMSCYWIYLLFCVPFQISKSNTTVIGRLLAQVAEPPSSRWLVAFGNDKEEQYAEEMLGHVVGRMEEDASENDRTVSPTEGRGFSEDAAEPVITANDAVETGTRNTKRRSTSQSGSSTSKTSPGDAISSGESSPAEDATIALKKKKKGVTFLSRSRSNSDVSAVPSPRKEPELTTTVALAGSSSMEISGSKVSDREQRSRRRQQISQEEAFQASLEASNDHNLNSNYKRFFTGTVGKNSLGGPKNKKFKLGGSGGKGDGDVLKVKLLTGTLFLSRGIHRHVEFIPRI
jgi:hypothetical protein